MQMILFLLQDPVNSMQTLKDALSLFSHLSGYKVNLDKSSTIGLNLTQVVKNKIINMTPAVWSWHVKYLRIKIPDIMDTITLIDLNLRPIINSMRGQLEGWQKLHLSWLG